MGRPLPQPFPSHTSPYHPFPPTPDPGPLLRSSPESSLSPALIRILLKSCRPSHRPYQLGQRPGPFSRPSPNPELLFQGSFDPEQSPIVRFPAWQPGSPPKPQACASTGFHPQDSDAWFQSSPARGLTSPRVLGAEPASQGFRPASSGPSRHRPADCPEFQAFATDVQPANKPCPSGPNRSVSPLPPLSLPNASSLPNRPLKVAVLGATGAVGQELLTLLAERQFPVAELVLLASPRSAGQSLTWNGRSLTIQAVSAEAFKGVDLVLASAGGSVSKQWAPVAAAAGALVIDNSSAFRLDPQVPLVVPEVNPQAAFSHQGIIANPNCTTILMTLALAPLAARRPLRRVVVSTYQSASGAGARAMEELRNLSQTVLDGGSPESAVLPYSLAFNLFLHNSPLQDNGYCEEELKMLHETRKIMGLPELRVTATCVRVPVLRAHSEALNIEFHEPFPVEEARALLAQAPGVELIEDFSSNRFPMPTDVTGRDPVAVGRIRQDLSEPNALELWLCGDQIRKGAALNAIQIAELLLDPAAADRAAAPAGEEVAGVGR